VFIVVDKGQDIEEAQARSLGADGILRKPFSLEQVTEELKKAYPSP
jgi:DNA-binding response OmpR family regulator